MTTHDAKIRPFGDLRGEVAVVVGGTSGIGLAIAEALARAGAAIAVGSSNPEKVQRAERTLSAIDPNAFARICEVSERGSLESFREELEDRVGPASVLVNAAGILRRQPTLSVTVEEWRKTMDVNVLGTLQGCQCFGAGMIERNRGSIINIASLNTFVSLTEVAAYAASKAAIGALTKSLAVEWGPKGVRTNAIAPGVLRTELNAAMLDDTERGRELLLRTPMGRFGHPDEIAGTAVYLASQAASFVNGEIVVVDGGFLASGVNS
ncbi:MAG: SDR family NAD(P)-dependent oxidoreductase [Acidimicrobiales bacterium]